MAEKDQIAGVLRQHVVQIVAHRAPYGIHRDAVCAKCSHVFPWDLAEREAALIDHQATIIAALVTPPEQGQSDA